MEDRLFPTGSKSAPAAAGFGRLYTHNKSVTWEVASAPGKGATGVKDAPGSGREGGEGGRGGLVSQLPPPPDRKWMNPMDVELWGAILGAHEPLPSQGAGKTHWKG